MEGLLAPRADIVDSAITHLKGEPAVHVASPENLPNPLLIVRVEPKLDGQRWLVPIDDEVGAVEHVSGAEVSHRAQVWTSVGGINERHT